MKVVSALEGLESLDPHGILNESGVIIDIKSCMRCLTHSCLRVLQEIVVWIYTTFDDNFGIKNNSRKYLKESC